MYMANMYEINRTKNKRYRFINLKGFVNSMRNRTNRKRHRVTGVNYLSVAFFESLFANKYKYIAENNRNHGAIFPSRIMTDTKASDLYLKLKPFLRVVEGDSNGNYPMYKLWGKSTDRTPFIRLGGGVYNYNLFVIWDCSNDRESASYNISQARELTFKEFLEHYNIAIQQGE